MVSTLATARATILGAFSSKRALAASIVAGTLLATSAMPTAAIAQRDNGQEEAAPEENSAGFAAAYRPLAQLVTGEQKDWASAAAGVPGLVASIENNRDKTVAGTFLLQTGINTGDDAMRRRGLELMHESGLVSERDRPIIAFNLGVFAYQANERDLALDYFLEAYENGYSDNDNEPFNDVEYLILQSYVSADRLEEAIAFGTPLIVNAQNAGTPMPDPFIRQTLQSALDLDDGAKTRELAALLVKSDPGKDTWQLATRITLQFADYTDNESLDLYRLMHKLGTMEERSEFSGYIGAANENLRPVEVLEVVDAGIASGAYDASDPFIVSLRAQVEPSSRRQRADIDEAFADARDGGGRNTDVLALNVADQLLALEDYERAITLYGIAQERGIPEGLAQTRIGMTQILNGQLDEGIATLAGVSGSQKPIADLWTLYAELELESAEEVMVPAGNAIEDAAM